MEINLEEEVEDVEVLEVEEGDQADKALTRPRWSAITVISLDIFNGNVQARIKKPTMLRLKKKCY
jgi:hypothetical protein